MARQSRKANATSSRRWLGFGLAATAALTALGVGCDLFFPNVEVHVLNATDWSVAYVEAKTADRDQVVYQSDATIESGSEAIIMLPKRVYAFSILLEGGQLFVSQDTDLTHVDRYTLRVVLLEA